MDALARAVQEDDVELAAIAIAIEEDPRVRAADVRARLDELASTLAERLGARSGGARMRALVRAVHRELGFFAPDDYGDPELHRIDRVLERRAGSPVALAVVLIALGRRAGVSLEPVAFPGHFLVRALGATPSDELSARWGRMRGSPVRDRESCGLGPARRRMATALHRARGSGGRPLSRRVRRVRRRGRR